MPSSPDPRRAERLADVYARADRLRRHRRALMGSGALAGSVFALLVALLVGTNADIAQRLTTIGRPETTTTTVTTPRASTSTTGVPLVVPDAGTPAPETPPDQEGPGPPPPTPPPTEAPPPPMTTPTTGPDAPDPTTTVPACRNSRDPACGPFRYDPQPTNEPMTVEVTYSPENPEPGEVVTFTVRVRDDGPTSASPDACGNEQRYGEANENVEACAASCPPPPPQHGPWDPPPPENSAFETTFRHTYTEAGTYTATFFFNHGYNCTEHPYYSSGEDSVTVTVG